MDFERKAPKGVLVFRTSGTKVEHHLAYESNWALEDMLSCLGLFGGDAILGALLHESCTVFLQGGE